MASQTRVIDGTTIYPQVTRRYGRPMIPTSAPIHAGEDVSIESSNETAVQQLLRIVHAYELAGTPLTMKGLAAHLVIQHGLEDTDAVYAKFLVYRSCKKYGLVIGPGMHQSFLWLFGRGNFAKIVRVIPSPRNVFATGDIFEKVFESARPESSYVGEALEILHLAWYIRKLIYDSKRKSMMWESLGLHGGDPLPLANGQLWPHLRRNLPLLLLLLLRNVPDGIAAGELARHDEVRALVQTSVRRGGKACINSTPVIQAARTVRKYLDVRTEQRLDPRGLKSQQTIYRLNGEGYTLLARDPFDVVEALHTTGRQILLDT